MATLKVDFAKNFAVVGHRAIRNLTYTELRVLDRLVQARGLTVQRRALLYFVWGQYIPGSTRKVDVTISRLRTKLPLGTIKSDAGRGYYI